MPIHNAKKIRALLRKKFRDREGKFPIEGLRLCGEALAASAEVERVIYSKDMIKSKESESLMANFRRAGVAVEEVDSKTLRSFCDTATPQGIVAVVRKRRWEDSDTWKKRDSVVLVLDMIRDPGNLGTIIRTAEAAGVSGVFLCRDTVELYNPKVVRSSMGSIFRVPTFEDLDPVQLLEKLRGLGFRVLLTDAREGNPYHQADLSGRLAIVLGGEAAGVSRSLNELVDGRIRIPMAGQVESLNVAVAAGVILFKILERRIARDGIL